MGGGTDEADVGGRAGASVGVGLAVESAMRDEMVLAFAPGGPADVEGVEAAGVVVAEQEQELRPDGAEEALNLAAVETLWIRVSDELDPEVPYVDFPRVRLVAQVRREIHYKKTGRAREPRTVYLLTSLGPQQAGPERLLELNR